MSQWQEFRETVLQAARKMVERRLAVDTSGNVSLRLPLQGDKQMMAITPTSRYYDTLKAEDIPIIDFNGERVAGNLSPSKETPLHTGIYKARKDINAIIHTHSVFASAAAVAGLDIPPILEDQMVLLGGEIKVAKYAIGGSPELLPNVLAALGDRNGVLLSNHGAVGTGKTMRDAFIACELIEKSAEVYFLALYAGKVNQLPEKAVAIQKTLYAKLQTREE